MARLTIVMGGPTFARVFVFALAVAGGSARAEVDVKAAMPVLLKVLTYDANFDSRGAGPFNVLIVSDAAQSRARDALLESLKTITVTKVKNRQVTFAGTEFKDEGALQGEIDRSKASALLLMPGVPLATVKAVWDVAQDNQLYALGLEATMVEQMLPVGVTMAGDKPQIIINEKSAKAVGVRFETAVLRLARVIQ